MAHGQPDFGAMAAKTTIFGLADMAELAARLGSIVTFDRRGDVIWLDDFEDNINKWVTGAAGAGAAVALSADYCRNGGKSAKLTLGDAVGNTARIDKYYQGVPKGKLGFEISFQWPSTGVITSIQFGIGVYDGTSEWTYTIKFTPATPIIQYWDQNQSWQTVTTEDLMSGWEGLFNTLKLVVNTGGDLYHRLIVNHKEIDMSAYVMRKRAFATHPLVHLYVIVTNGSVGNRSVYCDDAIVTQNEP